MPMPQRNAGESRADFIKRFMADATIMADYPDEKQRLAIAEKQLAGKTDGVPVEISRWARREGAPIELGKDLSLTGSGELTGYVATWDVDSQGERFAPGAFKRSILQAIPAGKVALLMRRHLANGADVAETIGKVVEAREDERGLWIRATFSASASGQDARVKADEGLVKYLSVGFRPIRFDAAPVDGKSQVVYREAEFADATITNRPANVNAVILSVKTEPGTPASGNTGSSEPGDIGITGGTPVPPLASTSPAPPVATVVKRDLERRRRRFQLLHG